MGSSFQTNGSPKNGTMVGNITAGTQQRATAHAEPVVSGPLFGALAVGHFQAATREQRGLGRWGPGTQVQRSKLLPLYLQCLYRGSEAFLTASRLGQSSLCGA